MVVEEVEENARALITALKLRRRYMFVSGRSFHKTTDRYLSLVESGNIANDHYHINKELTTLKDNLHSDHPYHPPGTQGDPYKIDKLPPKMNMESNHVNGVMVVCHSDSEQKLTCGIDYLEFVRDYQALSTFVSDGPLKSFCFRRLNFLKYRFSMHTLLNEWQESAEQKTVVHRDFYNIRKVDTHIHASSSMNQKHLLRFIKKCLKKYPNEEVFKSLGLTPYDLTIDKLDVHCDRDTFHRFDKFNAKYNPVGQSELREVFMKTDNHNNGRFFCPCHQRG